MQAKRTRTPTLLQMEAVECGAAALAIVMAFHGKWIPLEEMRLECGVSRDGSKASNMLKAARRYGMEARGFQKEPGALRALSFPIIVFWNFNHFVVVEGFSPKYVYLNDPASGPRKVRHEEFDCAFTGVVLTFEKARAFVRSGRPPSVVRSLAGRLRGHRISLLYVVLATLALVVLNLAMPVFSKVFVDRWVVGRMRDSLRPLVGLVALVSIIMCMLTWLQQRTLRRMELGLSIGSSASFFWHVLHLPIEFFAQRDSGDVASRVELNDSVAQLLSGELAVSLVSMLMIGVYAAVMVQFDRRLAYLSIAIAVMNTLLLQAVSRWRTDRNRQLQQDHGKLAGVSAGGLMMIETLKARGTDDFFARWAGYQAKVFTGLQRMGASSILLESVPALLLSMNGAAILGLGGLRVMDGVLTIGMLIAFQTLAKSFSQPVARVLQLGARLQQLTGSVSRLDDVLRYRRMDEPEAESGLLALEGELELRDLQFGYSRLQPPLLNGFSVHLRPGVRVALVGGSGSGKSTVAKLVCGLYSPWEGRILFDGVDRQTIARHIVARDVAMVDQDIFLFPGTIRDNLTLWDQTVPDQTIIQAAKDACIHDDITSRPRGYLGSVEEGGRNFSGGQRQRLEIARALVRNPKLLILDEATSSLDPNTEKQVADRLRSRGCTCLLVAHRLSTVRDCDEILVMDKGLVVERGTHEELLRLDGHYARLIRAV